MTLLLLIGHGLLAVALLGAVTHQAVALRTWAPADPNRFLHRYRRVRALTFANAVPLLYAVVVLSGGLIYPDYRLDVRIPLEELNLRAMVGLFELKEHFGGIGLGTLPLYWYLWSSEATTPGHRRSCIVVTIFLAFTVWWDFLVGHVLNNLRGLA
ncbi:hypothetical protein DFR24_4844 [Panacagrimonas perspica]|uniref:Uncharacterized protein n=1 Tax=Panacagrimonas perspica TaxID=381431 RepID=A0A4R7NR94_9GAMM|nr:hypothetical protein [Panacagrimonas perspica]TDU23318.1 hypothetical protein DFR24_4844 [Panacagrimonas perspica]THD02484.1 hypothetical protein B1810_14250 [Panacagrimonas perspica]